MDNSIPFIVWFFYLILPITSVGITILWSLILKRQEGVE